MYHILDCLIVCFSQALLMSPRKTVRKICKQPFKVLDAPQLQDDFYLNLVDWSSQNFLAVGLGSCTYLWDATSSNVTKLCDLAPGEDTVTSVSWADRVSAAVDTFATSSFDYVSWCCTGN